MTQSRSCGLSPKRTLREFWERHADAEQSLEDWYREVSSADWSTPAAVRMQYPRASIIGNYRVVFRVKGNDYRLVVRIFYPGRVVYIRFIGTHSEYDRINAEEV
ncbi:MAG: type II toxin-antitoxin system HigB family toxin [Chloroflexota bacterium]|nr:type II toxin-antitoxin system HigB family toxin [Chloroflexota bacterium]